MSPHTHWQHFYHQADIGVRGVGSTLAEAFEQAAKAMTAVIVDPEMVNARDELELSITAPNQEILLFEWLNALVYEVAIRKMLFSRFRVAIDDGELQGRARGKPSTWCATSPPWKSRALRLPSWQSDNGMMVAGWPSAWWTSRST